MIAAALAANDHIYVYGVARAGSGGGALPRAECEGVVPGRPVELVRFRGLAAIVSAFPEEAAAPEAGADQEEWARSRAVAHHQVLAELASRFPLAPSKFGTILRSLELLAAFIERHEASLEETLDRVAGCREWGLKLSGNVNTAHAAAEAVPSLEPLRAELAGASEGMAFFIRKKMKSAIEAEAQALLSAGAMEVHQQLDVLARQSVHIRACGSLSSADKSGWIKVLNAAYLVETPAEAEFHNALDAMRGPLATAGLSCALTGPWPPYNFVSLPSGENPDV